MSVVSFSLFGFETLSAKLWAFSQMGLAKPALRTIPDIGFFKLMGTGAGAGFSTRPNLGVYTILAEWPSLDIAKASFSQARVLQDYRRKSSRHATVYLDPVSSRGSWDGHHFLAEPTSTNFQATPVAALTRAAIRPSCAMKFWKHVPAISDRAEHDAQRHFMIGTGELPWFRQVTFSVWASVEAMHDFSRNSTTHGVAVRRAYDEGWFSEYCFTRFNILALDGIWPGLSEDALGLFGPNAKTIAEAAQ